MQLETQTAAKAKFGVFEADFRTGELRRSGLRVRLQAQPFRVLVLLLEHAGEVVSREELQQHVWGSGTVVDFEHSLGTAINKIRDALGDSAENPRFVETLARRGYRFIAPVTFDEKAVTIEVRSPGTTTLPPVAGLVPPASEAIQILPVEPQSASRLRAFGIWLAVLLVVAGVAYWFGMASASRLAQPLLISHLTYSGRVSPGDTFLESLPATATDGARIYFPELENGRTRLAQALIADGNASDLTLPDEIVDPLIADISPNGSKLLIRDHVSAEIEQTLWIVPTLGGAARQIPGVLAHDATWMPDGRRILYANGNVLWIADEDGANSFLFARLPGRPFWLRWSPGGNTLRMTVLNPSNHTTALWESDASGKALHPLLKDWSQPASECCGSWTSDGKEYVFKSDHTGGSNIWMIGAHSDAPVQLTSGPLNYQAPITARSGRQIFFVGADTRSELLDFSKQSNSFVPYGDTLRTAHRVVFSRDGQWMAWVSHEENSLWRSRVDGTERIQLTSSPTEVFMMNWSPDEKRILFMAREPGKLWQIESIDSDGGNLQVLHPENRNQADPDWSPDGKEVVFGREPQLMGETAESKALFILHLGTSQVETIPGSQGLFSPRWSPDGRYIAALSLDMQRLMLYDTTTRQWKVLAHQSVADPVWTHDSKSIFFHDYVQKSQTIYRISVPDGSIQRVADLADLHFADAVDYQFAGLTPEDTPLVRARMSTANIYSAQLPK